MALLSRAEAMTGPVKPGDKFKMGSDGGDVSERKVMFFGCIRESGHYLWESQSKRLYAWGEVIPWGYAIDGKLCPPGDPWAKGGQPQGSAALHHKDGWTALTFWDRTVDKRPGSNGAFLVNEVMDFDAVVTLAKQRFPDVWKRFTFDVAPVSEPTP